MSNFIELTDVCFVCDRFLNDGKYNIFVPAAVRAGPEDGHAAARRRRHRGEAQQTDRQVRRQHLRHARRATLWHAGTYAPA